MADGHLRQKIQEGLAKATGVRVRNETFAFVYDKRDLSALPNEWRNKAKLIECGKIIVTPLKSVIRIQFDVTSNKCVIPFTDDDYNMYAAEYDKIAKKFF